LSGCGTGGTGERREGEAKGKKNLNLGTNPKLTFLFVILAVFEPGSRFLFDTVRYSSLLPDSRITIHE
jgi:hypothetical protein